MPASFFSNGGHLSPKSSHNNAQGRSSTLSQYSDDASIYSSTFITASTKNHPSNFLALTPEPVSQKTSPSLKAKWLGGFSAGKKDTHEDLRRSTVSSTQHDNDEAQEDPEQYDDMPRMSVLGPSLRFHSRAPWELEGDSMDEEDEADYGTLLASNGQSRPSAESSRSQTKSQRSFETTSSQVHPRGALYALAQESLSTSSLGSSLGQAPSLTTFSLTRARSESTDTSSSATLAVQTSNSFASKALAPSSAVPGTRPHHSQKTPRSEASHPYANPAFALSHESTPSMHETLGAAVFRSDSITTVTDSIAPHAASSSKLHSAPSLSSLNKRRKPSAPSIHGKEISSPIVNSAVHLDDVASISDAHHTSAVSSPKPSHIEIPGWTDRGAPPPFNLISLEEARAQRSRAATQTSAPQMHAFPEYLPLPNKRPTVDSLEFGMEAQRVRSVSSSGKPKTALASLVSSSPASAKLDHAPTEAGPSGTGPPPGKVVKQKKSGFLRIFGGRAGEKDEKPPTPPLPHLAADSTVRAPQNPPRKLLIPRSPIHDFSPALTTSSSDEFQLSPTQSVNSGWKEQLSPKRSAPPLSLSINTRSPIDQKGRSSTLPDRHANTEVVPTPISPQNAPKKPWLDSLQPQSAPANMTEFPPLRLRHVSTFFSSQFQGLLDAESPSPEESTTPASTIPSNLTTPITPVSASEHSHTQRKPVPDKGHSPHTPSIDSESVSSNERGWQHQYVRDLEAQVRELQAELAEVRSSQYCATCGRGEKSDHLHVRRGDRLQDKKHQSIMQRPRAPTGNTSRFVNNLP